jgi:hypothetical protein
MEAEAAEADAWEESHGVLIDQLDFLYRAPYSPTSSDDADSTPDGSA